LDGMTKRTKESLLIVLLSVIVFRSSFAGLIKIPHTQEECQTYTTCDDCILDSGCGWCDLDQTSSGCLPGSQDGPTDPLTCQGGLWKYSSCEENDLCTVQLTCEKCLEHSECGWCDNICVAGNITQPFGGENCVQWIHYPKTCDAIECSVYSSCQICAQQPTCGWCESTGVCLQGLLRPPIDCPIESWKPLESNCTTGSCGTFSNCSDCISSQDYCGWCKSNSTCLLRGIAASSCPDFQIETCDDQCTNYRDCDACVEKMDCGWCESLAHGFCTVGDASGPSFFDESRCSKTWAYGECPACAENNCEECIQSSGCSWCWVPQKRGWVPSCFSSDNFPSNATCSSTNCTDIPFLSSTATISNSPSFLDTPSISVSITITNSAIPTPVSSTPSASSSASESESESNSQSETSTESITPTPSMSISLSVSNSSSFTRSPSNTTSESFTPSSSILFSSSSSSSTSFTPASSNSTSVSITPSSSQLETPSPTISQSNSASKSESSSSSQTISQSSSSSKSESNSNSASISESSSSSISESSSSSISESSSGSLSESSSASISESQTPTGTVTSSRTTSRTSSSSSSSSLTATPSGSVSGSISPTETQTYTSTCSPSSSGSANNLISVSSNSATQSSSVSSSITQENDGIQLHWSVVTLLCLLAVGLSGIILLAGGYLFYHHYWLKRWYFSKLR